MTGGARGIGRATVERLASEGARVAFCDVDADVGEQTAAEIGHGVRFHACDIADEQQIAEAVSRTQDELGDVTVLVNNAGVNANFDMATMTTDEWDRFMAVDLRGRLAHGEVRRAGDAGRRVAARSSTCRRCTAS